ncbi:MAG: FtsX-like permease family protein [Candidatus Thermoplasmatota archaeon]|nr:FtsX-like permease family protein [Candidatus Thermoplasmatota archaeon]
MMILIKKAARDLMRQKLRTISMILAIALSVGLGIGLVNATRDAIDSFDKRLEVTNYEDIDIRFEMENIDLSELEDIDGVDNVNGRIFLETQVRIEEERYKTHWISSPYHPGEPYSLINGYQLIDGSYISSENANEALVGHLFADANGVKEGDMLTVFYDNANYTLKISGVAASPEYIYVVSDQGWPEPSHLLPMFTTYEMTIDALGIEEGNYNELLFTVEDGANKEEVKQNIESYLTSKGVKITSSLLGTEELDYTFSRADANGMGQIGWIFGTIILVVTAVVIYNSMTKLISSQRAYIGVMGALGGRMRDIILHYAFFGFFMGLIGALLGIPLGIGISRLIITEYAGLIGLVDPVRDIYWSNVIIFPAIGVSIATIGALLGSLKAVSIGPREALTSQYAVQDFSKKPILEKLFDITGNRRSILTRVPLRNLSRHKLRTGVTLISLGVSLILVFSCLALAFGFMQPLQDNFDNYEKWDLKVKLVEPMLADDVNMILSSDNFTGTDAEATLDEFIPIMDSGELSFVHCQAFSEGSSLRNFNIIEGKYDPGDGILVGSILADKLDLTVGSKVNFVIGDHNETAEISGITGEFMDDSFLMTLGQTDSILGANGTVNSIILNMGGMSNEEIEELVRENFAVSSFVYTDDVINGMETMLQGLVAMFMIFIAFGVIAEILFISTTVVLNILDRETEFVSLRAIGSKPGRIRLMIVLETLILISGGVIIGLPLGFITTKWAMAYMVKDLMYYVINVDASVYIITAGIAIISAVVASFISARHITKVKLVNAIRHRST